MATYKKKRKYTKKAKVEQIEKVVTPVQSTNPVPRVECIDVVENFNFNRGNAIQHIWMAGENETELEDLKKALWYIQREIDRLGKP